jgi:hypothetical protein
VIPRTSIRELSSSFFFHQGKTREQAPLYATVKNWVAQFKRGAFSTCDAPRSERLKTMFIDQIHELILEDCRISAKSITEELGIWHDRVG